MLITVAIAADLMAEFLISSADFLSSAGLSRLLRFSVITVPMPEPAPPPTIVPTPPSHKGVNTAVVVD